MTGEVRLVPEAEHSPAQLAAWRQLWVLLLADKPQKHEGRQRDTAGLSGGTAEAPTV